MYSRSFGLFLCFGLSAGFHEAFAQCGEPSTDSPCTPRILPGTPGQHEIIMGVANATPDLSTACGFNLGHTAWFEVTPTVNGRVTFSTCHPATQYDTVVQVWRDTGDCEFPQRLDNLCRDDTDLPECGNGCSAQSSRVTFDAAAGTTYLFQVGAYNNNAAQCTLCLGAVLSICAGDASPPEAALSSPATLACVCGGEPIIGTADDAESGISSYVLEAMPADGGYWTVLGFGTNPVRDDELGQLGNSSWSQGYYYLRLTVENGCGATSTAVRMVWLDGAFDQIYWSSPTDGAVVGGTICLGGTIWDSWCGGQYTAEVRPIGGVYSPVDPNDPVYTDWVVNDPFAHWDTRGAVVDGTYQLRVIGSSRCGFNWIEQRALVVDNTSPIALITSPAQCAQVDGVVPIVGTVNDANLEVWLLQYTGGDAHGWVTIQESSAPVIDGVLAYWDTSSLDQCTYAIRLVVSDNAVINCNAVLRNQAEYVVTVDVGTPCPVDLNGDGAEDLVDYATFQSCFTGP